MPLQQFMHLLQLQVVVGVDGQLLLLPLHLAMRPLEVVSLLDLASHILQRVVDLGKVGLGNNVEAGHGQVRSVNVGLPF